MEKGPKISVVGNASFEKKEQAKKEAEQAFFDHFESLPLRAREQLAKFEYPKSEKELALIDFANQETNKLMREAGVETYNISAENYHIIPPELYKEIIGSGNHSAGAFFVKQGVVFNAEEYRDNLAHFGSVAFHETLHLKGYYSIEVEEKNEKVEKTSYREGMTVGSSQRHDHYGGQHRHFVGLHEAIVSAQEKIFLSKLFETPEMKEEKEWMMSDEAKKFKKELAKKKNISEDEIIYVNKKCEGGWFFSYLPQRQTLDYVCGEIQKEFPNQYQSADDVSKEFLKSHFTGHLLPIARLVEKTFGEGSFRLLGNMTDKDESGILHFESLKKARARQVKNKAK
ncbi:hypothetical protein KKG85_02570 [Patescibacteria group bacterium]|nr:hypothetical protein [Patescibacteria group bacterium]